MENKATYNTNRLIENYFSKFTSVNIEFELRHFLKEIIKFNLSYNNFPIFDDITLKHKDFYSDVAIYSMYLEIKTFKDRLNLIQTRSPDRTDLIESYQGTIFTLETIIDYIRNVKNDFDELRISRQRNVDLEIKILMQEKEIEQLKKQNEELINLI